MLGYCAGPVDAIQACVWTPGAAPEALPSSSKKGGKGKEKKEQPQRFTIVF